MNNNKEKLYTCVKESRLLKKFPRLLEKLGQVSSHMVRRPRWESRPWTTKINEDKALTQLYACASSVNKLTIFILHTYHNKYFIITKNRQLFFLFKLY